MSPRRVLLKISGEALSSPSPKTEAQGINQDMLKKIAHDIKTVVESGVEVCIVVGGGNIYRGISGASDHGIDRTTSDYMGMLATVINALALQSAIEQIGIMSRVMTAIPMQAIGEFYIRRRAINHMGKGRVVIFAAGTGNPFFTTDTAAALRALEMECDLLLKATKVDGVYDKDPVKHPGASHFKKLSYMDVLTNRLEVMDATAVALVSEHKLPLAVFSIYEDAGFSKVIKGQGKFTLISDN